MGKEAVLQEIEGRTGQSPVLGPKPTLATVHSHLIGGTMKLVKSLTSPPPLGLLALLTTLGPFTSKALFEIMAFGNWRKQRYWGI